MKSALTAISAELDAIREAGTWREERIITTPQYSRIDTTAKPGVVNFCANNYLGLSTHPELMKAAKEDLPQIMKEQGLVEGFDVGLEMSGNGMALQQMIGAMRNGGKISLLGISNKPVPMDMNTIITKGLTLQGIYGRHLDNWHQMSYMVQGGLDVSPVITHRFHYTEFEKGFEAMNSGKSGKVVLDWTTKKED